jgi:hypothetical protein
MKRRLAFLLVVHLFAIGAAADDELYESSSGRLREFENGELR